MSPPLPPDHPLVQFNRVARQALFGAAGLVAGAVRRGRDRRASSLDWSALRRVLVVRQHNQLGDMLCAVPLLRALRERLPEAEITLVTGPANDAVMQRHPLINHTLRYDRRDVKAFARALRSAGPFGLALVPGTVSVSTTSDLVAWRSGAPVRIGVGGLDGVESVSSFLLTDPVTLDWTGEPHRHQTLRHLDLVAPFGLTTADLSMSVGLGADEQAGADEWLSRLPADGPRIGLHVGAGKKPNRWPAERFAALADRLVDRRGAAIVLTEGPDDAEPVAATLGAMSRPARRRTLVVKRQPVRTVAAILSRLTLIVANDTGVLHLAAAAGAPTVSLFGPTDPLQWAPVGSRHRWLHHPGDVAGLSLERVSAAVDEHLQQLGSG